MTVKKVVKKTAKKTTAKDPAFEKFLYKVSIKERIEKQAERLGLGSQEVFILLKKKGLKADQEGLDFLKNQVPLEENTMDDLVAWRMTVRKRLFENEDSIISETKAINAAILQYQVSMENLMKKRQSDFDWYNKVSAIISKKTGMRSAENIKLNVFE